MRVALAQYAPSADPAESLQLAQDRIRQAAAAGANIVCLPELFMGPYFCKREDADLFELAEPIPGPTTEALSALAAELGVGVLASLFERRAAGVYHNSLALILPGGGVAAVYRKMHIPEDPGFHEKFYFTPGDTGFRAADTPWGRVGLLVCWDQWYPEAARLTALAGAEVLFYPTAIGWLPEDRDVCGPEQLEAWKTIQRSHAIANGVYVAAVNRIGTEADSASGKQVEFWGNSFAYGPMGEELATAGSEETLLHFTVDTARMEEVRRGWPFLRDRRIDAYSGLLQRFLD